MTDAMTTKKPRKQKAPPPFPIELIDQLLATVQNKDAESILAERMLAAELTHHLANEEQASRNHRNGTSPKKVLAPGGELQLDVPRDRLSSFEPKLVAKHQRRMPGFDKFGDKGYLAKWLSDMLAERDVHLVTKVRKNMKPIEPTPFDKAILRQRSLIETVFDELKNLCQIEHTFEFLRC